MKRLEKEKWDIQGDEESRQEYFKSTCTDSKERSVRVKGKAYAELNVRLDPKGGEKDSY